MNAFHHGEQALQARAGVQAQMAQIGPRAQHDQAHGEQGAGGAASAQLHADGFIIKPPKPADMEKTLRLALTRPRPDIDPFSYYKVATGTAFDRHVFGELVTQASLLLDEDDKPVQRLGLGAVKPGSRLARDLYNKTGQLLLQRGSEITKTQLRVLRQFPERFGVDDIEISCEPDSDHTPPSPTA